MRKTILAAVIAVTLALGVSSAASAASRHGGPAVNVHWGQGQPARVERRGAPRETPRFERRLRGGNAMANCMKGQRDQKPRRDVNGKLILPKASPCV